MPYRRAALRQVTVEGADMARAAQRCMMAALDHSKAATITLESDDGSRPVIQPTIQLPPQTLRFIAQLLGALSERKPVVLMPTKQELSTVEAANFLNVSRPFVIKEVEWNGWPAGWESRSSPQMPDWRKLPSMDGNASARAATALG